MDGDGCDVELGAEGALVEGFDILEDVFERDIGGGDEAFGEGVEHEGVVGVGGVSECEVHRRGLEAAFVFGCEGGVGLHAAA